VNEDGDEHGGLLEWHLEMCVRVAGECACGFV
jgi:hypothetical protein